MLYLFQFVVLLVHVCMQIIAREKRVAFIGISNWALDPAKMNRGVMLTRGEPSSDELTMSARGICSNQDNDRVRERLEGLFAPLSEAYYEICKQQKRDFFGLRDFYRFVYQLFFIFICICMVYGTYSVCI